MRTFIAVVRVCHLRLTQRPGLLWKRDRARINRRQELHQLLPVRGVCQSIDASGSGTAMRNVVEYGRERVGGAVVEKRLRKREQRQQRGRRKAIGAERRKAAGDNILAHLVERRWIESADRTQLVNQLRPDDRSGGRRRREVNAASGPLGPAVAVRAVGAAEQRPPGDHSLCPRLTTPMD